MGTLGILNVGAGDTKLVFDKSNPAEVIRASRIVKDMLRRGYALIVEVAGKRGKKEYRRVQDFDENTAEYIIADFDPVEAERADKAEQEALHEEGGAAEGATAQGEGAQAETGTRKKRGRPSLKRIPADSTSGVAVARSAGG